MRREDRYSATGQSADLLFSEAAEPDLSDTVEALEPVDAPLVPVLAESPLGFSDLSFELSAAFPAPERA